MLSCLTFCVLSDAMIWTVVTFMKTTSKYTFFLSLKENGVPQLYSKLVEETSASYIICFNVTHKNISRI